MDQISEVIAGYEGKAYISTDGGATLVEFAQHRKYDLNVMRDMLDASTKATAKKGWKSKKPGMADWNGTVDMVLASGDTSEDMVEAALDGAVRVYFAFDPNGSVYGYKRRTAPGYIKDYKESSPHSDIATFIVSVEGDGSLVRTTVPLMVTSEATSVKASAKQQLTVNTAKQDDVTWAVTGGSTNGTIDENGLFTAPAAVPTPATVTVTATHKTDTEVSASIVLTITAAS